MSKVLTNIFVNDIVMMTRKVVKGPLNMQLLKLAGVSRQTISLIERGDYSPSVALALKLAKICGVQVEDIFQYEEDES